MLELGFGMLRPTPASGKSGVVSQLRFRCHEWLVIGTNQKRSSGRFMENFIM